MCAFINELGVCMDLHCMFIFRRLSLRCLYGTLKQGCEAGIKLKLSNDGQSLVVTDVCEDHNHVV